MSDKSDYKKLWRKERKNNVEMHNAITKANEDFKKLLKIPGVMEAIKAFDALEKKKEAQNGRDKKIDGVGPDTKKA